MSKLAISNRQTTRDEIAKACQMQKEYKSLEEQLKYIKNTELIPLFERPTPSTHPVTQETELYFFGHRIESTAGSIIICRNPSKETWLISDDAKEEVMAKQQAERLKKGYTTVEPAAAVHIRFVEKVYDPASVFAQQWLVPYKD